MKPPPTSRDGLTRRRLLALAGSAAGLAALGPAAGVAQTLAITPRQTEGPFYPVELPLDSDNDLVRVAGRPDPASGTITNVSGRVLDRNGTPLAGTQVEIWQCDANGRYHHPGDSSPGEADPNFQGFGKTRTDAAGRYRFRTIRPVPYPGRTPHIHFRVVADAHTRLTTQMYVRGHPGNGDDFVLRRIRDESQRDSVLVAFEPEPDASAELRAGFDIVLGVNAARDA